MKAVILAGGGGTRLWPLSRLDKPKQFQKLISNKTMLQETIARLDFLKKSDIYISTNEKYLNFVKEQCPEIPEKQIIIEPEMRDTAPCIGLAATILSRNHPKEVMAVIYSDHLIKDKEEFINKLKIAEKIAQKEKTLNIIEVKAKFPNTNLGYVKIGKLKKEVDGAEVYELGKFIEKPDLETAKKFLNSFKYLWNTGYYVWRTDVILEYYKKYLPETYEKLMIIKKSLGKKNEKEVLDKQYNECQKISIDYGIMEKVPTNKVRIIPADFGWSDVGTFNSLHEELTTSGKENLIKGRHLGIETEGCVIYNETPKLIATLGLKNTIAIETEDALFLCPKNKSAELKKLIEILRKKNKGVL